MLTPFWAFMQSADGPVVNLYAPGTAQIGGVKLEVRGDYPVGDRVEIRVAPAARSDFTLALRIPAWSKRTELKVNDEPQPAPTDHRSGHYGYFSPSDSRLGQPGLSQRGADQRNRALCLQLREFGDLPLEAGLPVTVSGDTEPGGPLL